MEQLRWAPEQRCQLFVVNARSLVDFLKMLDGHSVFEAEGLPPDARVVGIHADNRDGNFYLTVESESFPNVMPGCVLSVMRFHIKHTPLSEICSEESSQVENS